MFRNRVEIFLDIPSEGQAEPSDSGCFKMLMTEDFDYPEQVFCIFVADKGFEFSIRSKEFKCCCSVCFIEYNFLIGYTG